MISSLVALQLDLVSDFDDNLANLVEHINRCEPYSFIVAPELCLTGYCYDQLPQASMFSDRAIETIKPMSADRTIALTMIMHDETQKAYQNTAVVFHRGEIVHRQSKAKLFTLNDEARYFASGDTDGIKLFEIDGLKVGVLICFELRFIDLWRQLRGADIIAVPSMWGSLRKQNLEQLSQALAVANQCYVAVANSAVDDMAKSSAVISPFGDVVIDDDKNCISARFFTKEIDKMRRYLDVGLLETRD